MGNYDLFEFAKSLGIDCDETICTIRWTVGDLLCVLEKMEIEPSLELVRRLVDETRLQKSMTDCSIENGWEIMQCIAEDLVSGFEHGE